MENLKLNFTRVREVRNPARGTAASAGLDFFIPKFTDDFVSRMGQINVAPLSWILEPMREIHLSPQTRVLIPSGIHVKIPKGYALIAFNKSGISTKKGLDVLACVIDEDYQGEIHLSLVNTSKYTVKLNENEKIVQFILVRVPKPECVEVSSLEELYESETERGQGGFGSTGS